MKKLLLLLLVVAQISVSNAQIVLKTYKNEFLSKENDKWVTKNINYESLTITIKGDIITLDDKAHSVYKTYGESYKSYKETGVYTFFSAYDESYVSCTVAFFKPHDKDTSAPFIVVMYEYTWYVYYFTQMY